MGRLVSGREENGEAPFGGGYFVEEKLGLATFGM